MESLSYLYVRFTDTDNSNSYDRWETKAKYIKNIIEYQSHFEITYTDRDELLVVPKGNLFYWTKKRREKY